VEAESHADPNRDPTGEVDNDEVSEESEADDQGDSDKEAESGKEDETDDEDESDDDGNSEQEDVEDSAEEVVPIDWTATDSPLTGNYKIGIRQVAESVAGQLGGKIPVLVAQRRFERREIPPSWLPTSLQKKCAPASAFLMGLITKCDKIFRDTNKASLDKNKGLIAR
jgi:hypothetical protein